MKRNLIWIILMGAILLGDMAVGQEIIIPPSMPGAPSIDQGGVYCYDIRTFELLDCEIKYTLSLGPNDGGHLAHSTPRPIGGLRFPGGDKTSLSLSINTRRGVVDVEYLAPEASGGVNLNITSTPPKGYKCVFSCFEERRAMVEIEGLVRLEDSGGHHSVLRDGTNTHPEGTYGTPNTIKKLKEIAQQYFEKKDRKLSINDLSLLKGGLFDINNNWATPHIEHRTGTDADINQKDTGGVSIICKDFEKFVEKKGQPRPSVKCESGGRIHIDFN